MKAGAANPGKRFISPIVAYLLAVALPVADTSITMHVGWLRDIPFSLFFASVAIVAWSGRLGPTFLAVVESVLLFNFYLSPPSNTWSLAKTDLAQTVTLFLVASFIGTITSSLRRAQREIARKEAWYRATLASIGDGVIVTDSSGKVTFFNAASEALTGWPFSEARGKILDEIFSIQDEATGTPAESPVAKVQRTQAVAGLADHTVLIRRDGTMLHIDDSGAPIFDEANRLSGIVMVFRDVSDKRLAERQLEEQTAALVAAQEGSNSAAWALDLRHNVTRWFPGGREIFGRSFTDFADRPSPLHLVEPADHPAIEAVTQRVLDGEDEYQVQFRVRWPNGETHWLEARGRCSPLDRKTVYGVTSDITARKLAEAAVLRSEKLSAVGQVASTMAHEINNPLAGLVNLIYLALADEGLHPSTREYLQTADSELARLASITRLTLTFARESPGEINADVGESVENVLSVVRGRLRHIHLVREISPSTIVPIKPHELRQVLLNVTLNAIDALEGEDCMLRISAASDDRMTWIRVEDNGCGISNEYLERIFDPFFSTKPEVGTGIGLWVSRELLQRHGGRIFAQSGDLGGGWRTRFEIQISLAPETGA